MAAGLGFKTFTTGEVLTAGDTNGYLMQGVLVFTDAAARDAAITAPAEGQFAYLKDTDITTYYTGSAWANLDTTGMVNPMTTTGDVIYSSSGSTPARLGIGSTSDVLTVAGGVPTWAAPSSGGKVVQVVFGSTTTVASSSSTTYADTNLTATITPTSASNNVLVFVTQNGLNKSNGNLNNGMYLRLYRGATQISEFQVNTMYNGVAQQHVGNTGALNYLDSPATTSATTYKTQFSNGAPQPTVYVQDGSAMSTIVLMEVTP